MTALSEEAQASSEGVSRRIDHLQDANVAINATLVQHGQMIEQNGQLLRQILAAVNNPPAAAAAAAEEQGKSEGGSQFCLRGVATTQNVFTFSNF